MRAADTLSEIRLDVPGKITATALELPRGLSYEDWTVVLGRLVQVHDASNFWIGDALIHGERVFGEEYADGASKCGLSEDRLQALYYVAERVLPETRVRELSWSFHREVAKLPRPDQATWLTNCRQHAWSLQDLRDHLTVVGLRKKRIAEPEADPHRYIGNGEGICGVCRNEPNHRDHEQVNVDLSERGTVCESCGEHPPTAVICRECLAQILEVRHERTT